MPADGLAWGVVAGITVAVYALVPKYSGIYEKYRAVTVVGVGMFSAGMAAERLGLLGEDVKQVYAIPISIASKSPYFDRASSK